MLRKIGVSLGLIVLVGFSCTETMEESKEELIDDVSTELSAEESDKIAGLLVSNCYACHSPNATKDTRIAPPMTHVKEHYMSEYSTKDEFVNFMSDFVNSPDESKGIMFGALAKFGVMPNMQYAKEDVKQIVTYIYTTDIDTDEWLAKYNHKTEPTFDDGDYLGLGRHIVMSTKKQLGKNLKQTIKEKGTKEAVTFCNLKAYPIVDSMALVHDAKIVRVSDKNRNLNNTANSTEAEYIKTYQSQLDNGEELKPILNETEDLATFYMPIVTNEMCIKCHGEKSTIEAETLKEINRLYPKDLATGYSVNQIRGVWRIEMKK